MKNLLLMAFYYLWQAFLTVFRYLFVSAVVMLAGFSMMSGQFPPKFGEIYQSAKRYRDEMDLSKNLNSIAKAHNERRVVMDQMDQEERPVGSRSIASVGPAAVLMDDRDRIKALEYEVALLKSKLASSEAELKEFRTRNSNPEMPSPLTKTSP